VPHLLFISAPACNWFKEFVLWSRFGGGARKRPAGTGSLEKKILAFPSTIYNLRTKTK